MSIRFRKARLGPEHDLVNKFLDHHKEIFAVKGLEVTVLVETFAEIGIPDVLIILWDKRHHEGWRPERNTLQKNDLKIVHFISSFGQKGIEEEEIVNKLCFSSHQLRKSITNLQNADLITVRHGHIKIKNFNRNFFVRKIISIEAKMNDWKTAINQAQLNQNFSSHSYLLLPKEKVSENVLAACSNEMGLLTYDGQKSSIRRKAVRSNIPSSYFSWMLNEYIGRQQYASCNSMN